MKIFKNILVSLITASLTVVFLYGGYSLYAADNSDDYNFKASGIPFELRTFRYNSTMNKYFNVKMEKFHELLDEEGEDFFKHENFLVPQDIDTVTDDIKTILDKCGEDNISTYCVSMGALTIYMDYVRFLNDLLGTLELPPGDFFTARDLFDFSMDRNKKIHEEIENAQKVMQATVSVYNEYKLAYPMHKKYREIIRKLAEYRAVMRDINNQMANFPVKFINVTSSQVE